MADPRTPRARALRKASTLSEKQLWAILRGRGFEGLKFRRQVPVGRYFPDFVCYEHRLIVELDGGIHRAAVYDTAAQEARDAWLVSQGFTIVRIDTRELTYPHRIAERIRAVVSGGG
jgi:very-short-patch-repair endonuclease